MVCIYYMSYVAQFYGTPVFDAWLGRPDRAYGISIYGSLVDTVVSPVLGGSHIGYKVSVARFPVEVVAAFFYAYVDGYFTEPIYVGLDVPSKIVYLALTGVKP